MIDKATRRKNRNRGRDFENDVWHSLMDQGLVIAKWNNQVDLIMDKMIKPGVKFNPFMKAYTFGHGFPDFVMWHKGSTPQGLECKLNGRLSREEKDKCEWYLKNNIFQSIWIASKNKLNEICFVEFKSREDKLPKTKTEECQ